jgi:hypothetical protein
VNFDFMIGEFIGRLERNAPALIVLVICMMMSWSQRRSHPRAATRAAVAFGWFLCLDLLALSWYTIGIWIVFHQHPREADWITWIGEATLSCLEAFGYILFLLALNESRKPHRPRDFYDDPGDFEERLKAIKKDDAYPADPPKQTDVTQKEV